MQHLLHRLMQQKASGYYWPLSETPFEWRFADGPIVEHCYMLTCMILRWLPTKHGKKCWRRETGLSPPVKYFTDRSFVGLLCFVLSCVCYAFVCVCLYVSCGHLLRKGWPLGSRLWCLTMSLLLFNWYPRSGVVLDCIDSWSLHPYLLWYRAFFVLSIVL